MKVLFLRLDEVLFLHAEQIDRYGGIQGVRDLGLLESAIASPEASFDGKYFHGTVAEKAAAYLFHIAQNHPFLDGNKRAAAAATFMFLYLNDQLLDCSEDELVDLTLSVAQGATTKAQAAVFISEHIRPVEE
ncbi:MAG: type II toxin-antitoxin system death-on-curing family toxin [Myxococcaceae bacterium]|nr:type II toxin-antitoxin system death-on-curing family toxin [Myxococcaceae bacterium]